MANLDASLLAPLTATAGNENLVAVKDGQEVGLKVNGILGLLASDVATVSGTSATAATRVVVCTSTSAVTLTLPAASGNLRDITVLKASATSAVTVTRAGSDPIVSGTSVAATTVSVAAGLSARLLSDGTTWYHVTNDA